MFGYLRQTRYDLVIIDEQTLELGEKIIRRAYLLEKASTTAVIPRRRSRADAVCGRRVTVLYNALKPDVSPGFTIDDIYKIRE
ncbi:MAG: hypothetical protein LBK41_00240 [Clostridiales bacterium]|nr:hypothetical protein [Clostridiales bacterium]